MVRTFGGINEVKGREMKGGREREIGRKGE
jgi:hypothetical protein